MYGGLKALLPVVFTGLVIFSSGCINIDPEAFARAMPMVQDFLDEHPNAELHIVHYSASEAEAVLDQIKEDCGKTTIEAKEYYFVNLTDPDTDLMVRAWIDWETQTVECIYKAGGSRQIRECESHYKAVCFNEHVYWVDSCGNRQEKKEFCPLGCMNGRCITETDKICDPEKTYEEKPDCVCPEGYEMLVIFPKCLQEAVQIEAKPTVADFVTGAVTSYGGETSSGSGEGGYTTSIEEKCVGGEPFYRCVKREMCRSHAEFRCYNGHVYWFDSCGHRQEKKEYCENGCELGFCREENVCESEGGYCVYPVVCAADAKICPDGTAVGRVPPECDFAPCPPETSSSGGGSATGMVIGAKSTAVVETITQTEIYPVPAEEVITGYNQCRPGYVPSGLYCPKNGLCCIPVPNKEKCFDYTVDDKVVRVCATCGNGVCERFETCTSTFCNSQGACTDDCGPLYCPEDCKTHECWDSDGGKNYHKRGVVEAGNTRLEDHCNEDGTLTEKYCKSDGQAAAVSVECPEGYECENGACTMRCAGEGEYTSGAVSPEYYYGCCDGLKGFNPYPQDWVGGGLLCYDPEKGTPECEHAGVEKEGWYYSGTGALLRHEKCSEYVSCRDEEYGCYIGNLPCCDGLVEVPLAESENGECIAADCGSVCRPCGNGVCDENENWCSCPEDCEAPATCYDSDGGKDYYSAGVVELGTAREEDYCDGDLVIEHYCSEGQLKAEDYACPHGCHEGACFSGCRDENYQCYTGEMQCCESLVEVESASLVNQTCIVDGCGTLCLECGNGVCEDSENECTCPEDCP
jgi:hypothetical protein